MYDLIIIGAGPAGITAAIYAARKRINFLVITKDIGGQAAWSGDIENYTGYQFITGPELVRKFEEHMHRFGISLKEDEEVLNIKKLGKVAYIETNKGTYETKTAIIASGKKSRELNVSGEKEFKNKGLSYCATCDSPLFNGKNVAVIGGGNSALDAAIQLMKIASHVYIIDIASSFSADRIMREQVEASNIVTVLNNTSVSAILGDDFVKAIRIKRDSLDEELAVGGVFVEIGLLPNSQFAEGLDKNELGEIRVNCRNETNVAGIFSAGDVTDVAEKQIVIAAGEGSKAALGAFRYLVMHR